MKRHLLISGIAACAALEAFAASPRIGDDASVAWDADRQAVAVTFRLLDAPAVVTLAVETNVSADVWAPVDERKVMRLAGPLNRMLQPADEVRTAYWMPGADWPAVAIAAGKLRVRLLAWPKDAPPPYLVADLRSPDWVRYYASSNAVPGGVQDRRYKTDMLLMRKIEAKGVTFRMGAPSDQPGEDVGSVSWTWTINTPHKVMLTNDYYIGVFEFTQGQYKTLMGSNPSNFKTCAHGDIDFHPVENIHPDWLWLNGDGRVITKLRARTGIASLWLPTGAEWEYASRAGYGTGLYTGMEINNWNAVVAVAWFSGNADNRTHAVGQKLPNAWGLYDTLGNVAEAVRDYFKTDLGSADVTAPVFPTKITTDTRGDRMTVFGEGYPRNADRMRSCCRNTLSAASANTGFRVAFPID